MSYFELPQPRRERCPFCDNVAGRVSERGTRCAVVSETDLTLTFVAPRRQHLGRLLVISKRHAPTLFDLSDDEAAAIMRDTRRAAPMQSSPSGPRLPDGNCRRCADSVQ